MFPFSLDVTIMSQNQAVWLPKRVLDTPSLAVKAKIKMRD